MKNKNTLTAYLLIGIGVYFLLRQLKLPIFTDFYSWPTILIIIGIALLIYSFQVKDYNQLFSGTILLGLGIHFHGIRHYSFWIDHWAMYPLIVGIAFLIRYLKTKQGLLPGIILTALACLFIFSVNIPTWFNWIHDVVNFINVYWPIVLVIIGIYLLKKK
ncbi:LiaI-LiaF-like domain-containing protein [Ornithinibacillus sp. 179-J 7C1 HS]|uniref:LiaI-LiaF-like domain-containing protein n=1 Tax=Ornithinibacillus sp. 179-J 7C1 HS TaxID=3142384 RepID=UPI0039A33A6C